MATLRSSETDVYVEIPPLNGPKFAEICGNLQNFENKKKSNLDVLADFIQLWPCPDLLVVTAGFYGSESAPKVDSIRWETSWGPVFARVAQKREVFLQLCNI